MTVVQRMTLQTMVDCLLSVTKIDALLFYWKKTAECIRKVFLKESWSEQNNYLFHITPERMGGRRCSIEKIIHH